MLPFSRRTRAWPLSFRQRLAPYFLRRRAKSRMPPTEPLHHPPAADHPDQRWHTDLMVSRSGSPTAATHPGPSHTYALAGDTWYSIRLGTLTRREASSIS